MFGKNNNSKNNIMKYDNPGQPNVNMISSGSVLTGSLHSKSDLRVSGTVNGEIHTESKCIISESGLVKGDIKTKEADVAGKVEGELNVSNKLILRASAVVIGDIRTKVLMVEEGAQINGSCKMGDQSASASGQDNNKASKGDWKKSPEPASEK